MWYAIAVWFIMQGSPMVMPITKVTFDSKSECVEYITSNSDYDEIILEQHNIIILDDGVKDMFAAACQTRTQEV